MSVLSMTGYGRGECSAKGITVEVELSSVNRKQFDLRLNLPRSLVALDSQVNKLVRSKVSRGSINGRVNVLVSGSARSGGINVDMDMASAYVKALRKAGADLGLNDDLSISSLVRLPDIITFEDVSRNSQKVWPLLKKAVKTALNQLIEMRTTEGIALENDIIKRFIKLEKRVDQIEKIAPTVPKNYRKALLERIEKMELSIEVSQEHLAKEVALFADRCDISEELTRLDSHFDQVEDLINRKEPAGRAFDFLCQEFLREINTIGSKANDVRLSKHVIAFKTELECVREQVQNIE